MKNLKFASEEEALQCLSDITGNRIIIATPLDQELSSTEVYNIYNKDSGTIAWLWDKSGSGKFLKGGKKHFNLAEKTVKKEDLPKDDDDKYDFINEIVEKSIRGYFFPETNQIAIYPFKSGFRYIDPEESIFKEVVRKLGKRVNKETQGIAIQDVYYA